MSKKLKVIISGGGTGGHIFPAIAIADAIKKKRPDTEFLFVGVVQMVRLKWKKYRKRAIPLKV